MKKKTLYFFKIIKHRVVWYCGFEYSETLAQNKAQIGVTRFLSSKFQRMSDTRIMSTIRTAAFEAVSESHYVLRNLQVIKFTVATVCWSSVFLAKILCYERWSAKHRLFQKVWLWLNGKCNIKALFFAPQIHKSLAFMYRVSWLKKMLYSRGVEFGGRGGMGV